MHLATTIAAARTTLSQLTSNNKQLTTSLVPTMGALHAGHLSLVARARAESGFVSASLFVNPTQFGPNEDFARYPRRLEEDLYLFEQAGVDLVFAPTPEEMYPPGATTFIDPGELGNRLDGLHRPGHFRGVATVVAKLFHILRPQRAYFGQKDAVQVAVLRQMVRDLDFPVELIACPIIRDADGLALSSRNAYLTPAERTRALALPRTLEAMRRGLASAVTSRPQLIAIGLDVLHQEPSVALEYLEAVHPDTLLPVDPIVPGTLIAIAARVGDTRLIDNFLA
jgi:pantoate--beta-alanine ligase